MVAESRAITLREEERALPPMISNAEARARLKEIREFVHEELKEGIDQDFAVIPGTGKKPSLLQPGAEKLIEKLGLAPTFPESSIKWAYENHEAGEYVVDILCQLINRHTRNVEAECWGSAGRSAQEELDASNARAREHGKPERTLSFRDKGLARNTAFKLAQKSALVGATLKAARLAVEFTQDVEDFSRGAMVASGETQEPVATKHYCQVHKAEFFKRGRMSRYAHPIGDTGKWCNEDDPPEESVGSIREVPEEPQGPTFEDLESASGAPAGTFKDDLAEVLKLQEETGLTDIQLANRIHNRFGQDASFKKLRAEQRHEVIGMLKTLADSLKKAEGAG